MKPSFLAHATVCLTTLLLPLAHAFGADQLDWDQYTSSTYTSANSYSNSYLVDGMLVNVTVGGSTGNLVTTTNGGSTQSPAVTRDLEGGTTGPENSLVVGGDFNNLTQFLSVTVTFRALDGTTPVSVTNVNFNIFDVDRGTANSGSPVTYGYVDQISGLQGTLGSNTTINPASVTPTSGNTVLNGVITGAATVNNTGTTSANANVAIDFGSQAISSFTFLYGNAATAQSNNASVSQADPVRQVIALHDINFSVPEPGTVAALAVAGLAGALSLRRHRRATHR